MNVVIEIGELELAEPAFRKRARIVATQYSYEEHPSHVRFVLQYQHDGEPGVWISDPSFPWHGRNFDSIIRAAAQYHERIEKVLKGEK